MTDKGLIIAAMVSSITAVMGAGLETMQGVYQSENFYWDLNDRTRAFMSSVKPRLPANVFPNNVHAGNYSAVRKPISIRSRTWASPRQNRLVAQRSPR